MRKFKLDIKREFLVLIFSILFLTVIGISFSIGKDAISLNRMGDSAIFEQVLENINLGKGGVSNVFSATQNFLDRGYAFKGMDEYELMDLLPAEVDQRDMMRFHAYYILYLISPAASILPSSLILALFQTAIYFFTLVIASIFVWKNSKSFLAVALFIPLILFNPNWYGGLNGWFYPDRVFIFFGLLTCYVSSRYVETWKLVIVVVLTAAINERAALIAGFILITYTFLIWRSLPKSCFLLRLLLGSLLLSYAYFQKNYYLANIYYSGAFLPTSLSDLIDRFSLEDFGFKAAILIASNFALIILSLFRPGYAFISAAVLSLNLFGNIGGAEKVGWTSHYHSYYFPVLIFSAQEGFLRALRWLKNHNDWRFIFLIFFSSLYSLCLLVFNVQKGYLPDHGAIIQAFNSFSNRLHGRPTGILVREEAAMLFPPNSLVVTDEAGMAMLKDRVRLDVFPVSAERADYLFIDCSLIEVDGEKKDLKKSVTKEWLAKKGFNVSQIYKFEKIGKCKVGR